MSHFKEKKQVIEQFCALSLIARWTMNEVIKTMCIKSQIILICISYMNNQSVGNERYYSHYIQVYI
jgi:hypothetical protein